jgi:hypothetical protein
MAAQRCFWRGGQRHCASDAFRGYREYGFPKDYRTGSSRWWEEMDREGIGGRRLASSLYELRSVYHVVGPGLRQQPDLTGKRR